MIKHQQHQFAPNNSTNSQPRHRPMDQPLDFSVKSPSSPGGESFCSQTSSRNKRSTSGSNGGNLIKDEQYWLRREKNNAAAKRSRDARRQKEEQTKLENQILRDENKKLRTAIEEHVSECPHAHKGRWFQMNL